MARDTSFGLAVNDFGYCGVLVVESHSGDSAGQAYVMASTIRNMNMHPGTAYKTL